MATSSLVKLAVPRDDEAWVECAQRAMRRRSEGMANGTIYEDGSTAEFMDPGETEAEYVERCRRLKAERDARRMQRRR